jgi:transcriptional regulator
MHNLRASMHKPSPFRNHEKGNSHSFEKEDIKHEGRLAEVLLYHSKGYSQSEIADKLNVNQSTVSRDLRELQNNARTSLDMYVKEQIPNEFQIYISGFNQIIKNLWEIVEDKQNAKIGIRDRTYVLSLLMQCYSKRIEMLVGGPDAKMNAKKHMDSIHLDEKFDGTATIREFLK